MNKSNYFIIFIIATLLLGSVPALSNTVNQPPRAFDKIYVTPQDILCTSEGTFYLSPTGETVKVSSISRDGHGAYILLIDRQCPHCGRIHTKETNYCEEGFTCPLWDLQPDPIFTKPNR